MPKPRTKTKPKLPPIQGDNQWFRVRLAVVYVVLVGFLALVVFRLAQLQIIPNPDLAKLARKQFDRPVRKRELRRALLDREGNELAVNSRGGSVYAHPPRVTQARKASRVLVKLLGGKPAYWKKRLLAKRKFVWLKRRVSKKIADRIRRAELPGVHVLPAMRRIYPNGMVAANVLGFVGVDGDGLAGLELAFDERLKVSEQTRASVYAEPAKRKGKSEVESQGIRLTLDRQLQFLVERELEATMKATQANAAYAVVMNPHTGEILALGQRPSFEPNHATRYSPRRYSNRAVSHLHEPGSTMKVLLAAEAIERKIFQPESQINCENGEYLVGRKTIREADTSHKFNWLSLSEVISFSSNIGSAKIAAKLGPEKVRAAFHRFGLLQKLNTGLPGEANARVRPLGEWTPLVTANAGFGQGVSVPPLHMVRAFAMIANGGYLVHPTLESARMTKPVRALSSKTAKLITKMLVQVTESEKGTGRAARIRGVSVAGETGTAQKYERGKGYRGGKYFSSFVGFAPAEQSQVVVGVFVDEPQGDYYASTVAAPLFKAITEHALNRLDEFPVKRLTQEPKQSPKQGYQASVAENGLMPNLQGVSLRTILRELRPLVASVEWQGSGYIVRQKPAPGKPITHQSQIRVVLQ